MDIATTVDRLTADPRLMEGAIHVAERFGIGREMLNAVLPQIGALARAGASDPARIAQSVQAATGVDALAVLNLIQAMTGAAQGLVTPTQVGVEQPHGGSMADSDMGGDALGPVDRLLNQG